MCEWILEYTWNCSEYYTQFYNVIPSPRLSGSGILKIPISIELLEDLIFDDVALASQSMQDFGCGFLAIHDLVSCWDASMSSDTFHATVFSY